MASLMHFYTKFATRWLLQPWKEQPVIFGHFKHVQALCYGREVLRYWSTDWEGQICCLSNSEQLAFLSLEIYGRPCQQLYILSIWFKLLFHTDCLFVICLTMFPTMVVGLTSSINLLFAWIWMLFHFLYKHSQKALLTPPCDLLHHCPIKI